MVRFLALIQAILLFFSATPVVMALQFSAGLRSSGSQIGGGQGSAGNLQNAGAASAALTAALAKQSLQKSQAVIDGLTTAQTQAADAAKADPNNGTLNGKTVVNGLQPTPPTGANQAPGLVPYNPSGTVTASGVPSSWGAQSGVSSISQTTAGPSSSPSSAVVTVTQNQQSAYLYWNHFNVGPQTTLNFAQSGNTGSPAQWIAFNKVMTASDPTHIFGKINAPGQVYILNQSGILFHAGSSVNVQALVASALPINPRLSGVPSAGTASSGGNGLLNLTAGSPQFLFDVANAAGGIGGGNVTVEAGAIITSPSVHGTGGKVALIGKNVINAGTINTPQGQTILAAGNQVAFSAHAQSDASLRGLDVYVGSVGPNAGAILNSGLIEAPEAAVTMVGESISLSGGIDSSTSVSLNGRVDLLAEYGATPNPKYAPGVIPFLGGSKGNLDFTGVIQILPEWSGSATAPGTTLTLPSVINLQGDNIHFGGSSVLLAPGASIPTGSGAVGVQSQDATLLTEGVTVNAVSGITLDSGAMVSVAGSTDVSAPMGENFLTIQLRGGELADSPLQQNNYAVRGQNITIDDRLSGIYNGQYWIGTPLGDATGFLNLIYRTVGELTVNGGSVSMTSQNHQVSIASGVVVDVSGGSIQYSGGSYATTKLITSTGKAVDISQATPDQIYTGIVQNNPPVYQPGYLSGGNAGYISISAPSIALNGTLYGRTSAGPVQLRPEPSALNNGLSALPIPGSLILQTQDKSITFSKTDAGAGLDANDNLTLSADLLGSHGFGNLMVLDYGASISVPTGVTLAAPAIGPVLVNGEELPGSSIVLSGANIMMAGSITAPGGKISLNAYTVSPTADGANAAAAGNSLPVPLAPTSDGTLVLGSSSVLSTAGLLTIDQGSGISYQPIVSDGGSEIDPQSGNHLAGISLSSFRADLATGSILDVSGGAYMFLGKKLVYGNAGYLSISTGSDPQNIFIQIPRVNAQLSIPSGIQVSTPNGGYLHLGSTLKGYSGNSLSGSLSLTAPLIQVGGSAYNSDSLVLSSEFLNQGGFAQFSLTGIGEQTGIRGKFLPAITIDPGTQLNPLVKSQWLANLGSGYALEPVLYQAGLRNPASFNLTATGYSDPADLQGTDSRFIRGDISIGQGSSITTDPWNNSQLQALSPASSISTTSPNGSFSSISLSASTISLLGSLTSPGGSISVASSKSSAASYPWPLYSLFPDKALVTMVVGDGAKISTAGLALAVQKSAFQRQLPYLNGGSISLTGNVAIQNATLDVSGTSGTAVMLSSMVSGNASARGSLYSSVLTDGSGGTITITGGEMLDAGGTILASAGGNQASGGTLNVSSGNYVSRGDGGATPKLSPSGFTVNSQGIPIPNLTVTAMGLVSMSSPVVGSPLLMEGGTVLENGLIGVSSFSHAGFANINLKGNVDFQGSFNGPINATQSLQVASGGALFADSTVTLNAPYVALGTAYLAPVAIDPNDPNNVSPDPSLKSILTQNSLQYYVKPTSGSGSIVVDASLIDVGNLMLNGINSITLNASNGDIRGYGTLDVAGNITLRAGQIYPPTDMTFSLIAYNYDVSGKAVSTIGAGITAGEITILPGIGVRQLPLSAGGTINLYANTIDQEGTLVAPFGAINIGTSGVPNLKQGDGVSLAVADLWSSMTLPTATSVTLGGSSRTSVSAIDPVSGTAISVPYGFSTDGTSWIDPTGRNISGGTGMPTASVAVNAGSLIQAAESIVDLRGGGQLIDYQWTPGNGGSRNLLGASSDQWSPNRAYSSGDLVSWGGQTWSARSQNLGQLPPSSASQATLYWSLVPQSYALLPGYQADYAPLAAFNELHGGSVNSLGNTTLAANLGNQAGYVGAMKPGASIQTTQGGVYSLLPALYAILPGAELITPTAITTATPLTLESGISLQGGSLLNIFNSSTVAPDALKDYQVYSGPTLSQLGQYALFGNTTSSMGAFPIKARSEPVDQPGSDAGSLQVVTTTSLQLAGLILGSSPAGKGATIDIAAPQITIGNSLPSYLSPELINSWSAGSLLLGGTRGPANLAGVVPVTVDSLNISVEPRVSLTTPDLVLAASDSIQIGTGASITAPETLLSPDEQLSVTGNGALLRVSSDAGVTLTRSGTSPSSTASLFLAEGGIFSGAGMILDSSGTTSIAPTVQLNAKSLSISAKAMALVLDPLLLNQSPADITQNDSGSLVISGVTLTGILKASGLNVTSYSTFDIYGNSAGQPNGSFGSANLTSLGIHAGEIRGFDLNGGTAALAARSILLDDAGNGSSAGPVTLIPDGYLELDAATISLGKKTLAIDQFANVSLNATGVIAGTSSGAMNVGTPAIPTSLYMTSPLITATAGNTLTVTASGDLVMQAPDAGYATAPSISPGAGITMNFTGATVAVDTTLSAPSGQITLHATGGDVVIGGQGIALLDVSGTSKKFDAVTSSADAGSIRLVSDTGNVALGVRATLNLSGTGASSAGTLSVIATQGAFSIDPAASLNAAAGANGGANGSLSLDVATLNPIGTGHSLISSIAPQLSAANFTQSLSLRIRTGDVDLDTYVVARNFSLTADQGSIDVTPNGVVDASGATGGSIALQASGSLILEPNSLLNVHGVTYDSAGKGGVVFLSAGAETTGQINPNAVLDLQTASAIDLGVTAEPSSSQDLGGVLHLRAPITLDGTDIQIASLDSTVSGASSIAVEGYRIYDLTGTSGEITQSLQQQVNSDAQAFYGSPGGNSDMANAIMNRLAANQPTSVSSVMNLAPGVEIINQSGDLTLNQNWDFSTFRVGVNSSPGFLTLRASGNVVFNASLSDGFTATDAQGNPLGSGANYNAVLMSPNAKLPPNFQSWSYQISAGADISAANAKSVITSTAGSAGSVKIGSIPSQNSLLDSIDSGNRKGGTANVSYAQTIRTGTGGISINASQDIVLESELATIYTAGTLAFDQTMNGVFTVPLRLGDPVDLQSLLYPPQFTMQGGNIDLAAGGSISHATGLANGLPLSVPSQMPNNWLQRYQQTDASGNITSLSWWVDFSNFFESVGALGGGNVTMSAGKNISNVDAVIPTNYRFYSSMSGSGGMELGGGNLNITTVGNLINGTYYVENGAGKMTIGGSIQLDPAQRGMIAASSADPAAWTALPTTVFLGTATMAINAGGSIQMGPVVNPFLLPMGMPQLPSGSDPMLTWISKNASSIPYFSTYGANTKISLSSLSGDVALALTASTSGLTGPIMSVWVNNVLLPETDQANYGSLGETGFLPGYRPWLQLASDAPGSLAAAALLPPTISVQAMGGSINLVAGAFTDGTVTAEPTLAPAQFGNLALIASVSVNGLVEGTYAHLNLSDANPSMIYCGDQVLAGQAPTPFTGTSALALADSGSTSGSYAIFQTQSLLHDTTPVHTGDANPLIIIAGSGDISGLNMISAKMASIMAGGNITDVAFYIQNVADKDITKISAGGQIILNDPSSTLRLNEVDTSGRSYAPASSLAGDLQISGPGTLEVTAGGNIDLGASAPGYNGDTTLGKGITSIGNARNPNIFSSGADVVMAAGVIAPGNLSSEDPNLHSLVQQLLTGPAGDRYISDLQDFSLQGIPSTDDTAASILGQADQDIFDRQALELFYIALRDAGRDYSNPTAAGYRNYVAGENAIKTLFGSAPFSGNITTSSRDVRSSSGGNISLLAPGGSLSLQKTQIVTANSGLNTPPPGIVTEGGGSIEIYTQGSVNLGISRIFTLNGGDIMIWSDKGNVAAGSSKKTVLSAPPTTVQVDPQSGAVKANLGGLSTGGGIGVLAAFPGAPVGNVDLIAPSGAIDAGDAGIRASGNLHLAATLILNADNIAVGGFSVGAPVASSSSAAAAAPAAAPAPASAPSSAASTAAAAASSAADKTADKGNSAQQDETPSEYTITIDGYGGSADDDDSKKAANAAVAPVQASL